MNIRARRVIVIGVFVATLLPSALAAEATRELHGSADAFAVPGVALAWGVQRGATEEATLVVVRVVTDPDVYADIAVTGIDPFTQRRQQRLATTPSAGGVELRTPRAHFAEFPRTEFLFYAPGPMPKSRTASLLVFYVGVPDSTPEFVDAAKLDAYLSARIAQLRGGKLP